MVPRRKKSYELSRRGLTAENIGLWREAYAEFPNDTAVCEGLMHALCNTDAETELCQSDAYDEKYLHFHEFYLKLLELYFDDGFYGIYAFYAVPRHKYLASIYLSRRNDEQKAQEHLKAAAELIKQYEGISDGYAYTSTLFNGYKSHRTIITNNPGTEREQLLGFIHGSIFDSVRNKDWFRSIEQELRSAG